MFFHNNRETYTYIICLLNKQCVITNVIFNLYIFLILKNLSVYHSLQEQFSKSINNFELFHSLKLVVPVYFSFIV